MEFDFRFRILISGLLRESCESALCVADLGADVALMRLPHSASIARRVLLVLLLMAPPSRSEWRVVQQIDPECLGAQQSNAPGGALHAESEVKLGNRLDPAVGGEMNPELSGSAVAWDQTNGQAVTLVVANQTTAYQKLKWFPPASGPSLGEIEEDYFLALGGRLELVDADSAAYAACFAEYSSSLGTEKSLEINYGVSTGSASDFSFTVQLPIGATGAGIQVPSSLSHGTKKGYCPMPSLPDIHGAKVSCRTLHGREHRVSAHLQVWADGWNLPPALFNSGSATMDCAGRINSFLGHHGCPN
jgi:hypothetical protein